MLLSSQVVFNNIKYKTNIIAVITEQLDVKWSRRQQKSRTLSNFSQLKHYNEFRDVTWLCNMQCILQDISKKGEKSDN